MAAGKIFAISFAINAMMGASFAAAMKSGGAAMQQLSDKTKYLNAEQKRLDRAWQESQNAIKGYSREMQQLQAQYTQGRVSESQYQASMQRIAQNMRQAGMSAEEYRGHLARLRQEMEQNQAAMKRLQAAQAAKMTAGANMSAAWGGLQTGMATVGIAAAPFIGMIDTAMDFEQAMSKVQAITRSDADAMQKLTDNARMLGETTQFSATQAAQAMSYLGMAGWDANQIIGGMPGLLALAAAGGTDLARTADIVSDDLTAFGLSADQAGHMADVFAVTVTRTNTNVEMLGETMKYAAPVATAFGASMEETAALAGIMANSGIKASQAGTALRSGFLRLAGPPKAASKAMDALGISMSEAQAQQQEAKAALEALGVSMDDVSGKPKKMAAILTELKNKTADLSREEKLASLKAIFGTEAATGWLSVLEAGPETFEKLVAEMENSDGEAQKMAETMMNNAKGAWTQFKSAVEGVAISFGTIFLPAITTGMKGMADAAGRTSKWIKENQDLVQTLGTVGAALAGLFIGFKVFNLLSAGYNYAAASARLFLKAQRETALGQQLLTATTTAQTRAMALLRAATSADTYRGLADSATNAYNRMRAITWGNLATGAANSMRSGWVSMKEAAAANITATKNFFVNGANTIKANAVSAARSVMTMARSFSIAGAAQTAQAALQGVGRAMLAVGRAGLAFALSPIGIALMAIAGAAYLIYTNWDKVGPFFMQLWSQISGAFANAWTMIQPAIAQLGAAFSTMIDTLGPAFASIGSTFEAAFVSIGAVVAANSGVFDVLISAAQMLATIFGGALVGAFIVFANVAVGAVTMAIGVVASVITGAIGVFTGLISFITNVFTGQWSAAWGNVVGIFESIFGMLGNIASSILGGIANTVNGIISSIKSVAGFGGGGGSEIPANAEGGIYRKGAFLTTFAEESPEAAIPLDGSQRAISLWQQAGEMLGVGAPEGSGASPAGLWNKAVDLFDFGEGGKTSTGGGAPMPTINISLTVNGNADPGSIKQAVLDAGQRAQRSFAEEMEAFNRRKARLAY